MELTILHLYPDIMNLYGEYANLAVLRRHLQALGASVTVRALHGDDRPSFEGADLIYMGAGMERMQKFVLERLSGQGGALRRAADRGAVILFTGSAMEILGRSVTDAAGREYPALGLGDYTTRETDQRNPGDVIAQTELLPTPVVGFMNKCSLTQGVKTPLFSQLLLGLGNESQLGPEGYVDGNIFATHITGPVLVKNPAFIDLVIRRLAGAKGWDLPEQLPVLPHEQDAYAVTLRELRARVK